MRQIVRDWVDWFNTGGPDALIARKAPGKPSVLPLEQRAALALAVEDGPVPGVDSVVRWRLESVMDRPGCNVQLCGHECPQAVSVRCF